MLTIRQRPPHIDDFLTLRHAVGWANCDRAVVAKSIDNSLFWVSIYDAERLVATGRVVGDGAMYFYIQDVIVRQSHQGQGLGKQIMTHIEAYLEDNATEHATIGLLAAAGKEAFYERFGYLVRDGHAMGHGMCKYVGSGK